MTSFRIASELNPQSDMDLFEKGISLHFWPQSSEKKNYKNSGLKNQAELWKEEGFRTLNKRAKEAPLMCHSKWFKTTQPFNRRTSDRAPLTPVVQKAVAESARVKSVLARSPLLPTIRGLCCSEREYKTPAKASLRCQKDTTGPLDSESILYLRSKKQPRHHLIPTAKHGARKIQQPTQHSCNVKCLGPF